MSNDKRIPKRISTFLFQSLNSGVTPRVGLDFIVVGRKHEITALLQDLDNVKAGAAAFRVITGRYGSGKSFLLQLMRNYAMERNFVVADADLSPERRLTGTKNQGVATYRELVKNLSSRTRPDGGALKPMLDRWLNTIQNDIVLGGMHASDPRFDDEVERRIRQVTSELEGLVHGFDFATVLTAYYRGHRSDNEELKTAALRWLRGEYTTRTEARQDLGVRVIIDDESWYDYLKLLAEFTKLAGYEGMLVLIDEAVNLYKITNTTSRHNNYEKLLAILNDTLQGKARHLAVLIGATPKTLEDPRRGFYSYEALRSRLQTSSFSGEGRRDMTTPVLLLDNLGHEELVALLKRVRDLHAVHHGYEVRVTEAEIITFLETVLDRLGAAEFTTPRNVLRDFVTVLNLLHQYPNETFLGVVTGAGFTPTADDAPAQAAAEEAAPGEGEGEEGEAFAEIEL